MTQRWITYQDRMTVTVPEGEVDGLVIKRFEVSPYDLWNLRQELHHGRGTRPGTYTKLVDLTELDDQGNPLLWMSDTDAEKSDHAEAVAHIQLSKARKVLINGLGLGMVVAAALTYDHVERVDVVERDKRVIDLVGPHYLKDSRVHIIHADAYEQMRGWSSGPRLRWDVGWSDIWPEIRADNIPGMDRLHGYYRRRCTWHGMWARQMCLKLRREERAYGIV